MEISSMSSRFGLETRMLATAAAASPSRNSRRTLKASAAKFSSGISLTSSSSSSKVSPLFGGSDFSSHSMRPSLLSYSSFSSSPRIKRNVITKVIPFVRGNAMKQPPPDLASFLFYNRIIYLGMALVPAVFELIIAEIVYLDYDDNEKPIYFYINSTGSTQGGGQLGYIAEAIGVCGFMSMSKAPFYTLAVGNAWGEAALILCAGEKGNRAALPSASIMLKQPYAMGQGQATVVERLRRSEKMTKTLLVELYAFHTGKDIEQVEEDIKRPKYLSPAEAIEYGIIDKVIQNVRTTKDHGVVSDLKKDNPV